MKEDAFVPGELEDAYRVAYLIANHIKSTLRPEEREELDAWVSASDRNVALFEDLTDEKNIERSIQWYRSLEKEKALERVKEKLPFSPQGKRVQFPLKYLSIAAALLVALGTASYFLLWDRKLPPVALNANKQNLAQPQPGGDRAVLRLADGSIVILDSSDNGAVENNAGVAIQNKDGQLYYKSQENLNQTGAVAYHTLSTPRGGQYQIKLADGTQVWLNAASTLRFPAAFSGNTRDVVLTGEAYFEVAKDPSKVFSVQVGGVAIQVTGTHFNVNGYNDDGTIKTTLLEGGVQVTSPPYTQKLSPGEEANVTVKGIQVRSADKEEAIGWKEGVFVFHNTPASTVVNHLARWYNLDVEYNDEVRTHLNATIKRNASIHQVLRLLEGTGDIKFQLKDKKLIIMK